MARGRPLSARRRKLQRQLPGQLSTVDVGAPCPEEMIAPPSLCHVADPRDRCVGYIDGGNDVDLHPSLPGAGFNLLHTQAILPSTRTEDGRFGSWI